MVVLDTNVLSALMHQAAPLPVRNWLDRQPELSVWTTAITIFELRHGIELLALGRRRRTLEQQFERVIQDDIEHRIVPFDIAAANAAGKLMAERQRGGRLGDLRDMMIAGVVIASHATLATRNLRHFADLPVPVVNPWESSLSR